MLSEEEKKAVEIFTDVINYLKKWNDNLTIIPEDKKYYEIVLNLITKLQKEKEEKDRKIEKYLDIISKNIIETIKDELVQQKNKEIDLKDKQIDLMSEFISKYHCFEVAVYDLDNECTHDHECKKCVKQYFETKAKKGE